VLTTAEGPFLYDDGPPSPHTGTPRSRNGLIVALLLGTAALAVVAVLAFVWVRGTPTEQAEEVAGVFLAALAERDVETAHALLCADERARVEVDGVAGEYLAAGEGSVVGAREVEIDGRLAQRVEVRWADGSRSGLVVIAEDGPRICGTTR
jgi:hypothetical protein